MANNLSLQKILSIFTRHIKLIILAAVVGAVFMYTYSSFFVKPVYSASAIILVQNYDSSQQTEATTAPSADRVWVSDLTSSATLADYCMVLFKNSPTISSVLEGCYMSITSEEETNFLRITISSTNPQQAADVANKVTQVAPEVYLDIYKSGKIDTIREASVPYAPSSPNVKKDTMLGLFAGIAVGCLIAFILELIDTTIKPDDDLFKMYKIPVFAEVVDFERGE